MMCRTTKHCPPAKPLPRPLERQGHQGMSEPTHVRVLVTHWPVPGHLWSQPVFPPGGCQPPKRDVPAEQGGQKRNSSAFIGQLLFNSDWVYHTLLFNSLIGMTMTSVTPGTQLPWHSCVVSCSLLIKETSYHWNKDSHLRTKRLLYVCEWSSLSTQGGLLPESTLVPKSRDAQVPS